MSDQPTWPIQFKGYWQDGDQDDPGLNGPWEMFTVVVHGEEARDSRELLPADLPALMEALGARWHQREVAGQNNDGSLNPNLDYVEGRWVTPWQEIADE